MPKFDTKFDFQKLPEELQLEIGTHLNDADLKSLAYTSHSQYSIFKPKINTRKFLTAVAQGNEEEVKKMLTKEILLLIQRNQVTDYSERTFYNLSGFQYAVWALDWHMWQMMIDVVKKTAQDKPELAEYLRKELSTQLAHLLRYGLSYIEKNGSEITCINHEKHFNLQLLIDQLDYYEAGYDDPAWEWNTHKEIWCQTIGALQRKLPANIAQAYCRKDRAFAADNDFHDNQLPRNFKIKRTIPSATLQWYPLTPSNQLGKEYAIMGEGDASFKAPEKSTVARDRITLSTLLATRMEDINALRVQLSEPFVQERHHLPQI